MPRQQKSNRNGGSVTFLQGMSYQPMSREEEWALIERAQAGDGTARDLLLVNNFRFIMLLAQRMYKRRVRGKPSATVDVADLFQEGAQGFLEGLKKFDPAKNCRLISYASWWINLRMKRFIERMHTIASVAVNKQATIRRLEAMLIERQQRDGPHRAPRTVEALAEQLACAGDPVINCDLADLLQAMRVLREPLLIRSGKVEEPEEGSSSYSVELICQSTAREEMERKEQKGLLQELVAELFEPLDEREQFIIGASIGLGRDKKLSLRKIGQELGLTPEGVRKIRIRALGKVKNRVQQLSENGRSRVEHLMAGCV